MKPVIVTKGNARAKCSYPDDAGVIHVSISGRTSSAEETFSLFGRVGLIANAMRQNHQIVVDHDDECVRITIPDLTINREGDVIDTRTGEVDPVLTAQYGMGIW